MAELTLGTKIFVGSGILTAALFLIVALTGVMPSESVTGEVCVGSMPYAATYRFNCTPVPEESFCRLGYKNVITFDILRDHEKFIYEYDMQLINLSIKQRIFRIDCQYNVTNSLVTIQKLNVTLPND